MRALTSVVTLLAACGRLGFDAAPVDGASDGGRIDTPLGGSYVATILASGPLVYYRLDETSGTLAADASGHGLDATYVSGGGTVDLGVPGALAGDADRAARLTADGNAGPNTAAYVGMPDGAYAWAGDFTIEGWLRPNKPPGAYSDAFVIWERYLGSGFRTGWTSNNSPDFWTSESGGNTSVISPTPLTLGVWNHLVFTKAGTLVTIYLAGQPATSGIVADYIAPALDANNCIGSWQGLPTSGVFDEIAIYTRALTAGEIAMHYAVGLTP